MAQIRPVTSEALEAQIRNLLPSQNGFGEDLQASNVIMPIIDLTSAAEGASTPEFLQRAWDFSTGHTTVSGSTSTLITTTGFWQVDLIFQSDTGGVSRSGQVFIDDGSTSKIIWETNVSLSGSNNPSVVAEGSFVAFLRAGDSLKALTSSATAFLDIWYRQVADVNGVLVNPLGFSPQ